MNVDDADRTCRTSLLTGPLQDRLGRLWPTLEVGLDVAAAQGRPGAPIGVRWTDGPSVAEVAAGLSPEFAADGRTEGYPVTLARFYSPTALAAALLTLHTAGQLPDLLERDRSAFWAAVETQLAAVTLPEAVDRRQWQRAALLAELAAAVAGGDAYTWARWLGAAGWAQVNPALDAVFGAGTTGD